MSNKKAVIFEMLRKTAIILGQEINSERMALYCEHLEEYELDKLRMALNNCVVSSGYFPSVKDIVGFIKPQQDQKDIANEMAGKIFEVMKDFGYYRAGDAKDALGEVAWFAVESFGGWKEIAMIETDNMPTARAQLRDMCKMAIGVRNRPENPNLLPFQRENNKRLQTFGDILEKNLISE